MFEFSKTLISTKEYTIFIHDVSKYQLTSIHMNLASVDELIINNRYKIKGL
jgi:hypothetical protein